MGVGGLATTPRSCSQKAATLDARELLAEFGINIDPNRVVETLKPVQRAMPAILRAVDELRRWRQDG